MFIFGLASSGLSNWDGQETFWSSFAIKFAVMALSSAPHSTSLHQTLHGFAAAPAGRICQVKQELITSLSDSVIGSSNVRGL